MPQKYILVTGASRGIGRSAALIFAAGGYHVFLNCSRSLPELREVQAQIEAGVVRRMKERFGEYEFAAVLDSDVSD